jgi:hypothetical protein
MVLTLDDLSLSDTKSCFIDSLKVVSLPLSSRDVLVLCKDVDASGECLRHLSDLDKPVSHGGSAVPSCRAMPGVVGNDASGH